MWCDLFVPCVILKVNPQHYFFNVLFIESFLAYLQVKVIVSSPYMKTGRIQLLKVFYFIFMGILGFHRVWLSQQRPRSYRFFSEFLFVGFLQQTLFGVLEDIILKAFDNMITYMNLLSSDQNPDKDSSLCQVHCETHPIRRQFQLQKHFRGDLNIGY